MSVHFVPDLGFEMTLWTSEAVITPRRKRCQDSSPCSTPVTSMPVRARIISGVMLPPALFLEEAKAFLRFFFGEL
jgi:hypothetical protein